MSFPRQYQAYLTQYQTYLAQYQAGSLSLAQFESLVSQLRWQDENGTWYALSTSGTLLVWDSKTQVWKSPPVSSAPSKPRFRGRGVLIALGLLLLIYSFLTPALLLLGADASAVVTAVESSYNHSGNMVYTVSYTYQVEGKTYSGSFTEATTVRPSLTEFTVKYWPFFPGFSLKPSQFSFPQFLVPFLLGVILLIVSSVNQQPERAAGQ